MPRPDSLRAGLLNPPQSPGEGCQAETVFPAPISRFSVKFPSRAADLIGMYTLLLFLALQVIKPLEMVCMGVVQDSYAPSDIYIAAMEYEGISAMSSEGQVLYLNGPKIGSLKVGDIHRVIRPEGKVDDPWTGDGLGIYYKEIGTVRIEAIGQGSATALVLLSCQAMLKGDLVVPLAPKTAVEFSGSLSNALTPIPEQGLVSSIVLAKDDLQEIAAGNFCFIGLGGRDGVKPGDRFTIFRPQPSFNSMDLNVDGKGSHASYSRYATTGTTDIG
jgi:hypothetical protein